MARLSMTKKLFIALALTGLTAAVHAQQASGFGADVALTIRDCTGIDPLDSCIWPGDPPHRQNRAAFLNFDSTNQNATFTLSEPGYGGGEAGVEFGGQLFTPTLLNMVESTDISRNGTSIFSWQTVTYTGTSPTEVPFGGEFSYTKTGTVDDTCFVFKDVDTGRFQIPNFVSLKQGCGSINLTLRITDLQLNQVVASERLQSFNGEILTGTTLTATVEMVPGRPYEVFAVAQTTARGAGQMIDSTNSFEIGLVDPDTGLVTKDVPPSLPQLQNTLIPASDENQPDTVEIDVLPGSADNEIREGRRGVIPVAILTTPDFDALSVDADTLQFGPGAALVSGPGGGPVDVDGDGDQDFVVHFRAQDADFACGDTTAYLSGLTLGDDIIIASDAIQVTGCP